MSLITISDLTTSDSFISEMSEIETGELLGGLKAIKIKSKGDFNTLFVVTNSGFSVSADNSGTVIIGSGNANTLG